MDLIKINNFSSVNETIKRIKSNLQNLFADHICSIGLLSRMYKELSKLTRKTTGLKYG